LGQEQCTSDVANFHNDVRALSCAMIIIREQEKLGLLKGVPRSISLSGSFSENDLRTDGLKISFKGTNLQTTSNMISFKPNIPISSTLNDNALFRVRDGGLVILNNLIILRSNQIGSENAPIVMIISESELQSNEIRKNSPGQLVIDNCILEGGNSASSNVWYNLGLAETCNVGYGAAIIADGQTIVQISESIIRTFEGPAVRALNGAYVTIDKNTILNNNGQRNRNTLNSMQTNVVCEGGIGTTTIDIALDNVTSFTSTGNGWIFSPQESNCKINATFNGEPAQPRSLPQINSANVIVNITNQMTEVTVNGNFLEPCLRTLVLELHEKDKVDVRVTQEFGVESSSNTVNWTDSENIIFQIPQYLLNNLNTSAEWEISIYESGKREQTNWVTLFPTVIVIIDSYIDITLVISIVVPIIAFIIAVIIIFIIAVICHKNRDNKQSELDHKNNEDAELNIQIGSLNGKEMKSTGRAQHKQQEDPQIYNKQ
ncbi:MAG: hypothetical protein EZS28_041143, partial [Streblomastix strix]